jgi:hypothetical protein
MIGGLSPPFISIERHRDFDGPVIMRGFTDLGLRRSGPQGGHPPALRGAMGYCPHCPHCNEGHAPKGPPKEPEKVKEKQKGKGDEKRLHPPKAIVV